MFKFTNAKQSIGNYPTRDPNKAMWISDARGNRIEAKPVTSSRIWAILDQKRRVGGSSGVIVRRPKSEESGLKAIKGHGHWRLCEIRTDLKVGDHCMGPDIIQSSYAPWTG
jgi:hypothetical protein